MRRIIDYWKTNGDFWALWFVVLLIALPVGALLGAVQDTIRQILSGY